MSASETATLRRTALYDLHVARGGRMVPFAGWAMPVQYKGIVDEHRAVRERAGVFDAVRDNYRAAALRADGIFIPAGEAWRPLVPGAGALELDPGPDPALVRSPSDFSLEPFACDPPPPEPSLDDRSDRSLEDDGRDGRSLRAQPEPLYRTAGIPKPLRIVPSLPHDSQNRGPGSLIPWMTSAR